MRTPSLAAGAARSARRPSHAVLDGIGQQLVDASARSGSTRPRAAPTRRGAGRSSAKRDRAAEGALHRLRDGLDHAGHAQRPGRADLQAVDLRDRLHLADRPRTSPPATSGLRAAICCSSPATPCRLFLMRWCTSLTSISRCAMAASKRASCAARCSVTSLATSSSWSGGWPARWPAAGSACPTACAPPIGLDAVLALRSRSREASACSHVGAPQRRPCAASNSCSRRARRSSARRRGRQCAPPPG